MKAAALLIFLFVLSTGTKVTYTGETVVKVNTPSPREVQILKRIMQKTGDHDVWTHEGILVEGWNHIRVKNETKSMLEARFQTEVMIEDVQELIESVEAEREEEPGGFFDTYRSYDEIVTELGTLGTRYPQLVQLVPSIGKSVQGRAIPAIVISAAGFNNSKIQRIYFQGGQHAREWIGPATVMYVTEKLLENYGNDEVVTKLLDTIEFVIVPLSNPDGYQYAFKTERLWRKNRKQNSDGTYGVDLNRNWNDHWGGQGSSGTPSSDTYRGTAAFSEPETTALSNYIISMNQYNNILGAIDFHSYSQLVLRPYGWTTANCPDNQDLKIIGDGVKYEIYQQSKYTYTSQRSVDLYITTGSASDWFYAEGIWAAYTIELRDTGKYGFILPPAQIIPTGEEIWASVKYFATTVLDTHP